MVCVSVNNQRVALAHLKKFGDAAHIGENGEVAVNAVTISGKLCRWRLMDWQMLVIAGLEAKCKKGFISIYSDLIFTTGST